MTRRPFLLLALSGAALVACGQADGAQRRDTVVAVLVPPDSVRRAIAESLAARTRDSLDAARRDSAIRATPGYVVDSARSTEEELRRFRAGLTEVTELANGATSRDELVQRFVSAVEHHDPTSLRRLTMTAPEFAWLVYPHSENVSGPYAQPAGLVWHFLEMRTRVGVRRLLDRYSSETLAFAGYTCASAPIHQGPNTLWRDCTVERRGPDGPSSIHLFGPILERSGRFKFMSLSGDF